MNSVTLTGNLVRDPEPRTFEINGKKITVVNFSIACSRKFKKRDGTEEKEVKKHFINWLNIELKKVNTTGGYKI